jgi:hypothetical protein
MYGRETKWSKERHKGRSRAAAFSISNAQSVARMVALPLGSCGRPSCRPCRCSDDGYAFRRWLEHCSLHWSYQWAYSEGAPIERPKRKAWVRSLRSVGLFGSVKPICVCSEAAVTENLKSPTIVDASNPILSYRHCHDRNTRRHNVNEVHTRLKDLDRDKDTTST